jgi:dethiobiotin synthetase
MTYIITGTDTDIGKTIFAAGLVAMLDAAYWKPIQAGLDGETDSETVHRLTGCDILPEAYRLTTACSPHLAAERDGVTLDRQRLALPDMANLVVEGAGGVLCPVTRAYCFADLFTDWDAPVILVASTRLGTINHSLLALEALRARDLTIHGIAFVGDANPDTQTVIPELGNVRHLGRLPHLSALTPDNLNRAFSESFSRADFAP